MPNKYKFKNNEFYYLYLTDFENIISSVTFISPVFSFCFILISLYTPSSNEKFI